jgi:nucleoside-diphosphate-sugar epimerase
MPRHVVFGIGQVGRLVAEQLVDLGEDVVAVGRHGNVVVPGAEVVAGDATDAAFTTSVAVGADVVYFCLNATNYRRWVDEFPPLQRGVLTAARAAQARLVVLDNLYAYGDTGGRDLVESLPAAPTSAKARVRAAMTDELLTARRHGQVDVVIGRASDYFGPGARQSALGQRVFEKALTGATAQVMGDPDQPHSYSYTPDVAAALITLATTPDTTEPIWHLPVAEARSTRQIVDHLYRLAGHRSRLVAAGPTTLRLLGLAVPAMREYRHTLYQFTGRWVVDDGRYRRAFGNRATPLDDALATTLCWYRDGAAPSAGRQPTNRFTERRAPR